MTCAWTARYGEPSARDIAGIGDIANMFRMIVVTCEKYENSIATVKVCVDGAFKAS
jgi:hypothetical protein